MFRRALICLLLSAALGPFTALAYSEKSWGAAITAKVTPESPRPGERVTISLSSYAVDLNRYRISWSQDSKILKDEYGAKSFGFTAPPAGVAAIVTARATDPQTQRISIKEFSFRPAVVDLLWQTDTSVPSFYLGKALPVPGSTFKIITLPNFVGADGARVEADRLVYDWSRNDKRMPTKSGYGKSALTFAVDQSGSADIFAVKVTDVSGSLGAAASLILPVVQPRVVFYEQKPLEGVVYRRALTGTYGLTEGLLVIKAEPYFFPLDSLVGLDFSWLVNGKTVTPSADPSVLGLEKKTDSAQAKVQLTITDPNNYRLKTQQVLTIANLYANAL